MRENKASGIGLVSIVLIYISLIVLILIFANQILVDISLERSFSNYVILPLAVLLQLLLLGAIIFNIVKLIKEKRREKPGIRFKVRLVLFFSFLSLLSSIPQGIISISFIDTAMNSWFSTRLKEGLEGGVQIAILYHRDRIRLLETVGDSDILGSVVREALRNPDRAWDLLTGTYPGIASVQGFNGEGVSVFSLGESGIFLAPARAAALSEGMLPKEYTPNGSIIRFVKSVIERGERYSVVISLLLPDDFETNLEKLNESLEVFTQIELFQTLFRIALLIFYSFFSIPIILLSILVSFFISDEMIRPIVNLEAATRHVAEGDFSFRILSRKGDELDVLINSFNSMIGELERTRIKTLQTEKVTAWQEIAQRMAHEIKNPLTPIKLSAQRILHKYQNNREGLDKVIVPSMHSIIQEVENLDRLLREFGDFARLPSPAKSPWPLKEIIGEFLVMYSPQYPDVRVDTSWVPEDHRVMGDKNMLKQVFSNLLKNSAEAMDEKGEIYIRSDLVRKGNTLYCRIQVQDNGSGISTEHYNQVFNPYFTTKQNGSGLGLSIVERIVFDHRGQIWFESGVEAGTTFFIDLPAEQ